MPSLHCFKTLIWSFASHQELLVLSPKANWFVVSTLHVQTDLFYLESTESDFTLFSLDWLHFQKKNNNKTTQQQKTQPLRTQHPAQIIGLSWSSWHIIYTWRIGISQQCSSNQYFHWGCDLKMLGFYLYTHILPSFLLIKWQ